MAYVATPLNVPTFLFSRNRIKKDHLNLSHLKEHVTKNRQLLAKKCIPPTLDQRILYRTDRTPCKFNKATSINRDLEKNKPWVMPPNLYDVLNEPYASYKGLKAAYWEKLHTKKPVPPQKLRITVRPVGHESQPTEKAYNLCNKYKGYFNSNARTRRPTSRFMVSDLTTCWKDPNEPGPLDYCGKTKKIGIISQNYSKEKPNPYKFLLHTCVPEKESIIHKDMHFSAGPGRYETRFKNICNTCAVKRQYPFITQEIEKQKMLKFRRLPYKKINIKRYCDPQFAHIKGHGFPHLFQKPTKKDDYEKETKETKDKNKNQRVTKDIKLYADPKYMALIKNPERKPLSSRRESIKPIPVKIFYNTLAKRVKRRHLQSNKKIAFMSGQTRWKDAERPPVMTVTKLEKIKLTLPPERRLYDHSITITPIEELKCRVLEIPQHMQPAYKIALKKRYYKFKPLPEPKILITTDDIHAFYENGKYVGRKLFFQPINPEKYYHDEKNKNDQDNRISRLSIGTIASLVSKPQEF